MADEDGSAETEDIAEGAVEDAARGCFGTIIIFGSVMILSILFYIFFIKALRAII
jgi:hypothetical protein